MRAFIKEPLLHFLLLGAVLFIAYGLIAEPNSDGASSKIVVTAGQIEHLAAGFAKTWSRPPTDAELKGLIDDWVREEIATREAIALGLDKDDIVIRRRLRQKLDFLSEDLAAQTKPTDAELNAYLQAHPAVFRIEPRITFSQVYLDPTKHDNHLARDTARVLAKLQQIGGSADISTLGDSILLERRFQSAPVSEIGRQFGENFAAALAGLTPGQWRGPIESGYGVHLVYVGERTSGRVPALAEVRDSVLREWANAQRLDGSARFYQDLLKRYTVIIASLEPMQGPKKLASTQ